MLRSPGIAIAVVACSGLTAAAQQQAPSPSPSRTTPVATEYVEVTATRIPETPQEVPASVTVVTGNELRARGATTLRDALATVQGVDIAPGADNGPASSVVELWGLKEFDAFLLVVDGVPWGGAFNPSVETIDLGSVERIEIVRGAAPVMYGATSFVGVIQVVHKAAGAQGGVVSGFAGNHGSGGGSLGVALPKAGALVSSVDVGYQKEGFEDPRTSCKRGYAAWRGEAPLGQGHLRLQFNGTLLDQQPASPQFFDGTELSPLVPLDANHNPQGAFLNVRRYNASVGYDQPAGRASWSTLLSYSRCRGRPGAQPARHGHGVEAGVGDQGRLRRAQAQDGRADVDRHPGRSPLRFPFRAPRAGRGLRQLGRAGEVRSGLRGGLEQGDEPRPLRPRVSSPERPYNAAGKWNGPSGRQSIRGPHSPV